MHHMRSEHILGPNLLFTQLQSCMYVLTPSALVDHSLVNVQGIQKFWYVNLSLPSEPIWSFSPPSCCYNTDKKRLRMKRKYWCYWCSDCLKPSLWPWHKTKQLKSSRNFKVVCPKSLQQLKRCNGSHRSTSYPWLTQAFAILNTP